MFHRYVALGDSGTEGVGDDPHPDGSERGWADRLAEILSVTNPQLLYANLAVRGRRIADVQRQQLAPALALEPDLVTVVVGINDLIRPGFDLRTSLLRIDEMLRDLRADGRTVVTATYPDLSTLSPVARLVRTRLRRFNAGVRAIAMRRGALLVDAQDYPLLTDARLWRDDRLHLSPEGHKRLAAATAAVLGFPEADHARMGLPPIAPGLRRARLNEELRWAQTFLLPWVGRRLTGRSSGDGRYAKRPQLQLVKQRDSDTT